MNIFTGVTEKKKYRILWTINVKESKQPLVIGKKVLPCMLPHPSPFHLPSLQVHWPWDRRRPWARAFSGLRSPWRSEAKTCGSELLGDGCTLHAPGLILMQRRIQQLQFPKLSSSADRGNAQQIDYAGGPLSHKWSHCLWVILVHSLLTLKIKCCCFYFL